MVTQRTATRSAFGFSALIVLPLVLSGCIFGEQKQFFGYAKGVSGLTDPGGGVGASGPTGPLGGGTPTPGPTSTPSGISTALTTQNFIAATSQVKKVDFLFVVDNSGSMADNQAALAAGFEQFANNFYRRADLDICTTIITTDRYLGRTGGGGYQRERNIACTKPAGSENWSNAQMQTHIDNLIADFKSKVNVGTNGSGTELPGKSLVAYLYDLNSWGDAINPAVHASLFRSDAVANISVVTDENNWFYNDPNHAENSNDIPAIQNAAIYNSGSGALDARKGIKNYLDEFFAMIRPSQGLSYSVTALLELTQPATALPGIAMNINPLVELVGRESSRGDIEGDAASFAAVYNAIGDALIIRANAFNLTHNIYEPNMPNLQDLKVSIVKASGAVYQLSYGSDFGVVMPNGIVLNAVISNSTQSGDEVSVDYRYELP